MAALAGRARIFSGRFQRRAGARLSFQTQEGPPVAGLPLSGAELLALSGANPAGLPPWLSGLLSLRLDQLSGGQRQYLALWSILAAPAELIFLDEPGNHLDRAGIAHLCPALRERAAQGAGILLASHDARLIQVCARVIHLEPADA
jgi:ABC-type transport system involved in cytochrome bd biosynthesis fused ATPase/permease subunit